MNYQTAKANNRGRRFPWQKVLGRPLRDWCYLQFSSGATKEYCFRLVSAKLEDFYDRGQWLWKRRALPGPEIPLSKAISNAKIGVTAAWSEYSGVKKRWYGV